MAFAPVIPVVELVRFAETVPDETESPLPTITPPIAEVVAAGIRPVGRVPELMFAAFVVSVVALVASPVIVLAACVPV
jgi:hypothetical protein